MTTAATILAMALALYGIRLAGLLLARVPVPPKYERILAGLPVATLAALVVIGLAARPEEANWRWPAAAGAAVVAMRWPRMEVCIIVGMAIYALLRLGIPGR